MTAPQHRTADALIDHITDRTSGIPDAAADLAWRAVVDTVGVALAAASEPCVTITHGAVPAIDRGPSTVLVSGRRTDPVRAAWLNGTAAHALDYDDVDDWVIGHPSTVLVPAVLAVGELADAGGEQVIDAYWVGLTTMRALAVGLNVSGHYAKGWHATATLGVLGAAAATARLLGLDADDTRNALGIAVSHASGSRQNFGTMVKPLHAGTGASSGVLSGTLARDGLTADPDALDGRYGFLALYRGERREGDAAAQQAADQVRQVLSAPPPPVLNVKRHPCCYATHAAADAVLDLRTNGLTAADIAEILVSVPSGSLGPLIDHPPRSGLDGKFSLEYVVAAALLDGALPLSSFTDTAVARQDVARLARRVRSDDSLQTDPVEGAGMEFRARVTVLTQDGRTLTHRCDAPVGHADRPLTDDQLREKFDDCVRFGGRVSSGALFDALSMLQTAAQVADALRPLAHLGREVAR